MHLMQQPSLRDQISHRDQTIGQATMGVLVTNVESQVTDSLNADLDSQVINPAQISRTINWTNHSSVIIVVWPTWQGSRLPKQAEGIGQQEQYKKGIPEKKSNLIAKKDETRNFIKGEVNYLDTEFSLIRELIFLSSQIAWSTLNNLPMKMSTWMFLQGTRFVSQQQKLRQQWVQGGNCCST